MAKAYLFDIDGTLVDSNYQHALSWFLAFRDVGVTVPIWRLHRAIGMGGDMLVAHVTDSAVEHEHGDAVRAGWERHFDQMLGEVCAFADAHDTVLALKNAGHPVALASSGKAKYTEAFLDLLKLRDEVSVILTGDDVERAKPHSDLLEVAMERLGTRDAVMVGDSIWDCEAAKRAGIPMIGTAAGGFAGCELEQAGAQRVVTCLAELV